MPGMNIRVKEALCFFAVFLVIGLFTFFTINSGHDWGDDFAQYILHAANIVNGKPYADTGYIVNPDNPGIGPSTYPPIFPLILASVYAIFGLNLTAFKFVECVFLLGSLMVTFFLFNNSLSFTERIVVVLLLGLHPVVNNAKNSILADIPFLFFLLLTLKLLNRIVCSLKPSVWIVGLAGILSFVCMSVRSIGMVLIPVLLLEEGLIKKKIPWIGIRISFLAMSLLFIQSMFIPYVSSYFSLLFTQQENLMVLGLYYLASFIIFWKVNWGLIGNGIYLTIMISLSVIGFYSSIRQKITIFELFFLLYFMVLIIWPYYQGIRFMFPLLFLSANYLIKGLKVICQKVKKPRFRQGALLSLLLFSIAGYVSIYRYVHFEALTYGVENPDSQEMFNYIRTNTAEDAVAIFFKPRAFALFTGRRSSGFTIYENDQQFFNWMEKIGVDYLVTDLIEDEYNFSDGKLIYYADSFAQRHPGKFISLYNNPSFRIYKLK
jgi:hypothetical protein